MRKYLFNTDKIKYAKGERPQVDCILCSIRDNSKKTENLEVYRSKNFFITVNLYPFNPGHLMIIPKRHILEISQMTNDESIEMHKLLVNTIDILKKEFNPDGFNVGYNIGKGSGASIDHLHQHIVPRFNNEIGFLDVLSGTRVIVSDPVKIKNILKTRFKELDTI